MKNKIKIDSRDFGRTHPTLILCQKDVEYLGLRRPKSILSKLRKNEILFGGNDEVVIDINLNILNYNLYIEQPDSKIIAIKTYERTTSRMTGGSGEEKPAIRENFYILIEEELLKYGEGIPPVQSNGKYPEIDNIYHERDSFLRGIVK